MAMKLMSHMAAKMNTWWDLLQNTKDFRKSRVLSR